MGTNNHHHQQASHILNKKLVTRAIYCLIPLALLHFYFFPIPSNQPHLTTPPQQRNINTHPNPNPNPSSRVTGRVGGGRVGEAHGAQCNYSDGEWVPDERGPRYNGTSCGTIKEGQNCMAHGRPDSGYLHWRWRAKDGCDLTPFDASAFLRLMENKHLAFIGDSMARNQLESLLCLLSTESLPNLVYRDSEENKFRRWQFPRYNASVSVFWSPFLVKGIEKSAASGLNHNRLFMDLPDERWASELDRMDMVVFSTGHWFLHPAVYFEEGDKVLGCHHCPEMNHTEIGFFEVFRKAFKTTLNEVRRRRSPPYVVVTTFSPAHFEGEWDKAGACPKKEPYKEGEKQMEYMDSEMRKIEVEEVQAVAQEAARRGETVRFEALDVTKLALMRPDGHPGPYMYPNPFADGFKERVQNDCVHWCLPGPIDTWNEILLEMMKKWKDEES